MKGVFFLLFTCISFNQLCAQSWKQLDDSIGFYFKRNELEKTVMVAERAVIAAKIEFNAEQPQYAMSLNKLGQLYIELEKYENAIPVLEETIKAAVKSLKGNYPATYVTVISALGGVYGYMGQFEKSEPLYKEALEVSKQQLGKQHQYYRISQSELAELYNSMGEYKKAESFYLDAIETIKKNRGENSFIYFVNISNLAGVYENMEDYKKAEGLYLDAVSFFILKKDAYPKDYATAINNLAALYHVTGEYEKAEPLYLQSMEDHKKLVGETHALFASSLNNLGLLYFQMGRYAEAEALLLRYSDSEITRLKREITGLSEKEKQQYLANTVSLPQSLNNVVFASAQQLPGMIKNNFNLQLLLKSLTLSDTRNMLAALQQSGDTALLRLLEDWQLRKSFLARQYALPVKERRSDIKTIENGTEDLEKELNRRSVVFRNQQAGIQVSMTDVQQHLHDNEVVIDFVKFNVHNKKKSDSVMYAAYVLRKNDSVPVFVPLFEEKQLQKLFDSAGTTATSMVQSFYRGTELKSKTNNKPAGKALYELVWAPLTPHLKGIKKVSYSPAGKLFSIAFHALQVDSNTLLMDKYELQQYISTRQVALRDSTTFRKPGSISLFGDARFTLDSTEMVKGKRRAKTYNIYVPPSRAKRDGTWSDLPGTAEEINKITQLFARHNIENKTFTQDLANEEMLKSLSGNAPQVLHIATHGFFLPQPDTRKNGSAKENIHTLAEEPLLRSGLIFAGGNYTWSGKTPIDGVEDGIATAYEISQLNLSKTELVVLSACETALGDVKGSEGVFGLQRAFKLAGVKKMIVSLWQVPDLETAELMTTFYTYWLNGISIQKAFTRAQGDMRKKYPAFYWAAFVLVE